MATIMVRGTNSKGRKLVDVVGILNRELRELGEDFVILGQPEEIELTEDDGTSHKVVVVNAVRRTTCQCQQPTQCQLLH